MVIKGHPRPRMQGSVVGAGNRVLTTAPSSDSVLSAPARCPAMVKGRLAIAITSITRVSVGADGRPRHDSVAARRAFVTPGPLAERIWCATRQAVKRMRVSHGPPRGPVSQAIGAGSLDPQTGIRLPTRKA